MTLEELFAKREIEDLLCEYCRATDRIDDALCLSVWHKDGTVQYFDRRPVQTIQEFLSYIAPGRLKIKGQTHAITNVLIKVHGDVAYSESYSISFVQYVPEDGKVVDDIRCGRYLDRWSKRNGKWGIEHRKYVPESYAKFESPEAWALGKAAGGIIPQIAKRSPDDPSYDLFRGKHLEDGAPKSPDSSATVSKP